MNTLDILVLIWSIATAAFVGLLIYRSHLTRHETNELFLSEEPQRNAVSEAYVVKQLSRMRPYLQTSTGAFAVASLLVVGTYVAELLPSVRL